MVTRVGLSPQGHFVHLWAMGRLICRIAGTILALGAVASGAQEPLTVDRAVQAALANNASLRAARAGAEEASLRRTEARSGFYPRVTLGESWRRGDQPVFVFSSLLSARRFGAANFAIDALNHPDPVGLFQTSIGVEQSLFDGGRQRAAAAIASIRADSAQASTHEATAAVAVAVTRAFARLVAAEAARRAADAAWTAAREDLSRARSRRDAGVISDADVLALSVHVADLEQRVIQSSGNAASARAELNRLMGTPVEAVVHAVEPSSEPPGEVTSDRDLAALFAEADAARPELARAAASVRMAEAARRQARAALVPHAAAQAAVEVSGTRFRDRASSWVVGGELRWTLSTGGGELAGMRAAAATITRARAEMDDVRAGVHVEVINAVHDLETARARQTASSAAVEQARESQRIIRDRFEAGITPVNDVLRASTAVLDAEANRISALVDAMVARAMFRRALGRNP